MIIRLTEAASFIAGVAGFSIALAVFLLSVIGLISGVSYVITNWTEAFDIERTINLVLFYMLAVIMTGLSGAALYQISIFMRNLMK